MNTAKLFRYYKITNETIVADLKNKLAEIDKDSAVVKEDIKAKLKELGIDAQDLGVRHDSCKSFKYAAIIQDDNKPDIPGWRMASISGKESAWIPKRSGKLGRTMAAIFEDSPTFYYGGHQLLVENNLYGYEFKLEEIHRGIGIYSSCVAVIADKPGPADILLIIPQETIEKAGQQSLDWLTVNTLEITPGQYIDNYESRAAKYI